MTSEILCVGTELLLGQVLNTNTYYISQRLAEMGINVYKQGVVGDNRERLLKEIELCYSRSDLLILTGGLGPTFDDMTKETVAEYFGLEMKTDQQSLDYIKSFFDQWGKPMTENNKKQALVPVGATVLKNNYGTAPGIAINRDGKIAIMLPGPPKEMKPMFENEVIPYLQQFTDCVFRSSQMRIFGMGESEVEDRVHDYIINKTNPTVAPYAGNGEMYLRITARARNNDEADVMIREVQCELEKMLGNCIYGIDVPDLQTALYLKLKEKNCTISTAESCTGGFIAKKITDVSGISAYFKGGVCTYANSAKVDILGVSSESLDKYGAVSEQVACEMAAGAQRIYGTDIAVSTTGIAGPDGGTEEKPVGLVWVGVAFGGKVSAHRLTLGRNTSDSRERIREQASKWAIKFAIDLLK